jgi:hypothetical protein
LKPAFTDLVTEIAERLAAEIRGEGLVEFSIPAALQIVSV